MGKALSNDPLRSVKGPLFQQSGLLLLMWTDHSNQHSVRDWQNQQQSFTGIPTIPCHLCRWVCWTQGWLLCCLRHMLCYSDGCASIQLHVEAVVSMSVGTASLKSNTYETSSQYLIVNIAVIIILLLVIVSIQHIEGFLCSTWSTDHSASPSHQLLMRSYTLSPHLNNAVQEIYALFYFNMSHMLMIQPA